MRVLLPLTLLTALAMAGPALAQDSAVTAAGGPGLITVSGVGETAIAPDMAQITSGVTTSGKTAREALDANSEAMAGLIDTLAAAGIENRDIQTTNFSVNPQYVYTDQTDENGYQLPPRIVGYEVVNSVTVRVRDLDSLGAVLDQAVTVGANTIYGISFDVSDDGEVMNEARRLAVADARARAELLAGAAGVELGALVGIAETQGQMPMPMYRAATMEMAADAGVPVEGGELAFTATVTVQWEIAQPE